MNKIGTGNFYKFGGFEWRCAELHDAYAVLQSTGVTSGCWPGCAMSGTITNASGGTITLASESNCYDDIDGYDISSYDETMQDLYGNIKAAEYSGASYGKGLFLVSNRMAGTTTSRSTGSGSYWSALMTAASNYSSFDAFYYHAWLGTVGCCGDAWSVNSNGYVCDYNYNNYLYVVAPAFNVDLSKIRIEGENIVITDKNP